MGDPTNPARPAVVVARSEPGRRRGAHLPEGKRYAAHHALLDGDIAYLGYGDAGMVVLDVSDLTATRCSRRI